MNCSQLLCVECSQYVSQSFFRSLVLQPKPDLNEIVAENRDRESPVSLDNTEELLVESNKHLPGKGSFILGVSVNLTILPAMSLRINCLDFVTN